jgi:hypothetical protein
MQVGSCWRPNLGLGVGVSPTPEEGGLEGWLAGGWLTCKGCSLACRAARLRGSDDADRGW